ncbi:MAG: exodeoxyribonuclease VII small subunit [Pseudomonadota bacterium]
MARAKTDMKFETAMKELGEIVAKLESPELPLEESISLFEQGTVLSKICARKLSEAEKKIEQLLKELSKETSDADA